MHLGRGPDVVQIRLVQAPEDLLRRGRRGQWLNCPGNPHRENPPLVQRLTQSGVIQRQIAGQRVDSRDGARPDPSDRLLHLVDQGLHITGITGMAHGQLQRKDEARRWLGDNPRFAAELGGAVAFALADRGNGGSYALTILQ